MSRPVVPMSSPPEPAPASAVARLGLALAGLVHAGLAIAWMSAMAGGFEVLHRMSLANRWIPGAVVLVGGVVVIAVARGSLDRARRGVLGLLGLWIGLGAAVVAIFDESGSLVWLVSVVLGAAAAELVRMPSRRQRGLALVPGIVAGAAMAWAQRSPPPQTRPQGGEVARVPPSDCRWDGTVDFAMGDSVRLRVDPLLTFDSVSPDRTWTVLAPGDAWRGRTPRCVGLDGADGEVRARFEAEGETSLIVRTQPETMALDATTRLPAPVYSHLDHFVAIAIEGTSAITLTSSPCPEHELEPLSVQGRGDFAYVDAGGEFVVVRTASAEKGPFEERCRAALPADGRIDLIVSDGGRPVGRIGMLDWAAQADRSPSPTAGWGVAANAIEAWRVSATSLYVSVTLSATSIGRGWHSVGHAAGTYRNRVELSSQPVGPDG